MIEKNQQKILKYFDSKSSLYTNIDKTFFFYFIKRKELKIFKKIVKINHQDTIIDLASGSGFYLNEIIDMKPKEIFAVDLSKKMLNQIKNKNIIKIHSKIENLTLNKQFSKIFCFGLLEFCLDASLVLKKISNLSNENSDIYFIIPRKNFFGIIYKFFHYVNGFKIVIRSKKNINDIFKHNDFKIVETQDTFFSTFIKIKKNV